MDEPNAPAMDEKDVLRLRDAYSSKIFCVSGDFKKNEILMDKRVRMSMPQYVAKEEKPGGLKPVIGFNTAALLCKETLTLIFA